MIYISFDIGIKNLALCILKRDNDNLKIIDWRVISLADSKKEYKGINNISEILYYELDNIIGELGNIGINYYNYVIIENQPSNLNGIMKKIQLLIYSYFNLLKHWDKIVDEVILINPSLKLQYHNYEPDVIIKSTDNKTKKQLKNDKYRENKTKGIDICKYYIHNDKFLNNYYIIHKKKDDLADTLLQVIAYLRKNSNNIEYVELYESHLIK